MLMLSLVTKSCLRKLSFTECNCVSDWHKKSSLNTLRNTIVGMDPVREKIGPGILMAVMISLFRFFSHDLAGHASKIYAFSCCTGFAVGTNFRFLQVGFQPNFNVASNSQFFRPSSENRGRGSSKGLSIIAAVVLVHWCRCFALCFVGTDTFLWWILKGLPLTIRVLFFWKTDVFVSSCYSYHLFSFTSFWALLVWHESRVDIQFNFEIEWRFRNSMKTFYYQMSGKFSQDQCSDKTTKSSSLAIFVLICQVNSLNFCYKTKCYRRFCAAESWYLISCSLLLITHVLQVDPIKIQSKKSIAKKSHVINFQSLSRSVHRVSVQILWMNIIST